MPLSVFDIMQLTTEHDFHNSVDGMDKNIETFFSATQKLHCLVYQPSISGVLKYENSNYQLVCVVEKTFV